MRIGIITFWETQDNYGQMLQNYALQQVLKRLGHESYLIRYSLFSDWAVSPNRWKSIFSLSKIISYIKRKIKHPQNTMNTTRIDRKFNEFKSKYLNSTDIVYHTLKELQSNPPFADVYICGSDQIWYAIDDYHVYKNITRAYFLDFGDKSIKRIAYAPSFGRTDFPEGYYKYIKPLLSQFQLITVREKGGIEVCKKVGYTNVYQVLDPTCLLEAEQYRKISVAPQISNKYILVYCVGKCDIKLDELVQYAKKQDWDIYYIGSQGEKIDNIQQNYPQIKFVYPTINEWLGWIDYCTLLVTNSFHGAVFSILFNKQNVVSTGKGLSRKGGADRFYTLFENVGLLDRIYTGNASVILGKRIDYKSVNKKLVAEKNRCVQLLKSAIDSPIKNV